MESLIKLMFTNFTTHLTLNLDLELISDSTKASYVFEIATQQTMASFQHDQEPF